MGDNSQGGVLTRQNVYYIIVHCTATRRDQDYTPEQMEKDHKGQGYYTTGYHFYIRKDGTITQHRPLNEKGAHCKGWNSHSIGVCYEGGYDNKWKPADTRTEKQKAALRRLIDWLLRRFDNASVLGHRDMPGVNKACPCFDAELEYNQS